VQSVGPSAQIGPVHKRDITKCSIQLAKAKKYAIILGFDVKVDRDAQLMADNEGIRIFTADIIYVSSVLTHLPICLLASWFFNVYAHITSRDGGPALSLSYPFVAAPLQHLENNFRQHMKEVAEAEREKHKFIATFPCRLQILPMCVFNARDPIVVGVKVLDGQVKVSWDACKLAFIPALHFPMPIMPACVSSPLTPPLFSPPPPPPPTSVLQVGTPIVVPSKEMCDLGVVSSIQVNNEDVPIGKKGEEVCIKVCLPTCVCMRTCIQNNCPGAAPI